MYVPVDNLPVAAALLKGMRFGTVSAPIPRVQKKCILINTTYIRAKFLCGALFYDGAGTGVYVPVDNLPVAAALLK